jgi:hypothetical protein
MISETLRKKSLVKREETCEIALDLDLEAVDEMLI